MKFELILTVVVFIILFIQIISKQKNTSGLLHFVNVLLLLNLIAGFVLNKDGMLFNGMFHTNSLVATEKNILNLGTLIISMQSYNWLKNHEHMLEFYLLLLCTLLGMFFMLSAGNFMIFYLGLELSTIPLAAMVNFNLHERRSSEGALKLIMSSAFSSGLLLLGLSFIYGTCGSLDFGTISRNLQATPLQLFSLVLLLGGFAFKLSVAPFHLWTADVYEGAPVAVTAYLSVISKGAFFFALLPVLYVVFKPLSGNWYPVLFALSVLTMLIGNFFALRQANLKRLLAFSSISQAGFIIIGISGSSREGAASMIYFLLVYIFSNLGAFGVIGLISSLTGKERIDDYRGLYNTNPFLCWVFGISLFSLAGVPPTAGFFGKFFLLLAGAGAGNYVLITIAALNMIVSLYYYLVLVKAMFIDANDSPVQKLNVHILPKLAMVICVTGIMLCGVLSWFYEYIYALSPGF